ncbi:transcriptional regulator [Burkholderia sp. Bp9002]|nr:transcriptional regulator [Burkholderia sp. Bp9002]
MRFTIACPHCGARGIARSMEQQSDTVWLIDYQCDDVTCGHTYRTRLEMEPPELPIPKRPRRETQEFEFNV